MFGGAGVDALSGGAGVDLLVGGEGNDSLNGGLDADQFYMSLGGGADTVADFNRVQGDKLNVADLLSVWGNGSGGLLSDFLQISTAGGTTTVSIDVDGLGAQSGFSLVATLTGVTGITTDDLILSV